MKKLAKDAKAGLIFGSWNIPPKDRKSMISMVFMPILFMKTEDLKQMNKNKVIHIFEYINKAGPRSINGYPNFMSFYSLREDDYKLFVKYYNKLKRAEERALKGGILCWLKCMLAI